MIISEQSEILNISHDVLSDSTWVYLRLDEVCEENIETFNPQSKPDVMFKYIDISSVDNVKKSIVEHKTLYGKNAPSRARQIVHAGDVLIATTRPNLNAVAIVPPELDKQVCSTGFCVLRPKANLDSAYLFAFVRSPYFVDSLSKLVKGALYPAVTDKQVRNQVIPLTSLAEQKRIVAILETQSELIAKARICIEAQIEATKKLPTSYLREVFDRFEDHKWVKRKIGDFAETCSGMTPLRSVSAYYSGDIPWVKTGELRDDYICDTDEHVSELALKETTLRLLPANTLLVAMYGQGQTRGRTGLLLHPATINQACFAILPQPDLFDSVYLQWWFRYNYKRIRYESEGRGGNQPNLNGLLLRNQQVPFPPLKDQRRIASELTTQGTATSRLLRSLEEQLHALGQFTKAILQQAFEGGF